MDSTLVPIGGDNGKQHRLIILKLHQDCTNAFLQAWVQMNFAITHKMHLLLVHSDRIIKLRKGITHLSESRIERILQVVFKDNQSTSRMPDNALSKKVKLQKQSLGNDVTMQNIAEKVKNDCSRKRKGVPVQCNTEKTRRHRALI